MTTETYKKPSPDFAKAFDEQQKRPAFAPFGATVILKPIRPEVKEQTAGGLFLPSQVLEAEKAKPISAIALYEVVVSGPDARVDDGSKVWVRSYVVDSFDPEASFVACEMKDIWAVVLD